MPKQKTGGARGVRLDVRQRPVRLVSDRPTVWRTPKPRPARVPAYRVSGSHSRGRETVLVA